MPNICGIIAEYDPLHTGHAHHIEEAKKASGADLVVAVISCAFTQRGLPALFSTRDRAQMALNAGCDLVLGMPYCFGTAQANRFARGGVGILNRLGCVTHLSFGVEESALPRLDALYEALSCTELSKDIRLQSKKGVPMPQAIAMALAEKGMDTEALSMPNTTLALCYMRALKETDSRMLPVSIPRSGNYHARETGCFPSASAVRLAFARGDWRSVKAAMPAETLAVIEGAALAGRVHFEHALDLHMILALNRLSPKQAALAPEISEGLENRILAAARRAVSREELIRLIKTRRYPRTRLQRALTHLMTGLTEADCPPFAPYARLLGFKDSAKPILLSAKKQGFPLISSPGKNPHPLNMIDLYAESLWWAGAGCPTENAWRTPVIVDPPMPAIQADETPKPL